jgi:hypothetical protein
MYLTPIDDEWWREDKQQRCPDCPKEDGCRVGECMEGEEDEDD